MLWLSRMDALAAKVNPLLEVLAIGLAVLVATVALTRLPEATIDPASVITGITTGD